MSRFVIVSFLPENLNQTISRVRDHFEPRVNAKIPPHVSLTYPFWWKGELNELVKRLEAVNKEISSFQATITDVKYFSKTDNTRGLKLTDTGCLADRDLRSPIEKLVIYAQVLPEEPFKKIHDSLQRALTDKAKFDTNQFPQKKLPPYVPHITLAMSGAEKDVETAQKMISSVIGYSFMVEKLNLLKKDKKTISWQTVADFYLNSKKE